MKDVTMRLLAIVATTALAFTAFPAAAVPITFSYTGIIVDYTAPIAGQYAISATGARGGSVLDGGGMGGLGAQAGGMFSLAQGDTLRVLVGQAGADNPTVSRYFEGFAGGGGGSFVIGPDGTPLVIAGGGGGGGQLSFSPPGSTETIRGGPRYNGGDALTGPNGGAGTVAGSLGGVGGTSGSDGQGGELCCSGTRAMNAGQGLNSFSLNFSLGAFGGGGLANDNAGGGGGGGYSGGGGGGLADYPGTFKYGVGGGGGGGGGSFTAGADPFLIASAGTGNGQVTIITPTATTVPEPASLALLGVGLFGLGALGRSAGIDSRCHARSTRPSLPSDASGTRL